MFFCRKNICIDRKFNISNKAIERETEARFLGVITNHTHEVSTHSYNQIKNSKIYRHDVQIKAHFTFEGKNSKFSKYGTLVQCHLNYCLIIWGFAAKSNIESLFQNQKKAMRAIMPGYVNYF